MACAAELPDRPDQIAFQGTPGEIGLGRRPEPRLDHRDPVQNGIEPAVASSVEPVPEQSSRRGLQGRHSRVGCQLRLGVPPTARPQDAS